MKHKPKNPAYGELKDMIPAALIINGAILVGIALYGLFEGITWRAFTGLILGNILFIANFILPGKGALATVTKANAKQGKFHANMYYGMRYVGLFICLGGAMWLKVIDIVPAFLPLFIPKIHYTAKYLPAGKNPPNLDNCL